MKRSMRSHALIVLTLLCGILLPCGASADQLLLWNRFESEANAASSDVGPGFEQASYIYSDWQEARIEPAIFGNGLFVNHDTNEGWNNDGANFFATSLNDVGLTPERGAIEFWFQFKYDSSTWNSASFFHNYTLFDDHFPAQPARQDVEIAMYWTGGGGQKYYSFYLVGDGWQVDVDTPVGSAGPGGNLEFGTETQHHFAAVWDKDGIDGSADTVRLYVNGDIEAASSTAFDPGSEPFDEYLHIGTYGQRDPWDHHINAVKGVTDNLKIWDYAKADYSDRFTEVTAVPTANRAGLIALVGGLLAIVTTVLVRRLRATS